MTDPYPHQDHNVVEWDKDPVAGFPKNIGYCYDCREFYEYRTPNAVRGSERWPLREPQEDSGPAYGVTD